MLACVIYCQSFFSILSKCIFLSSWHATSFGLLRLQVDSSGVSRKLELDDREVRSLGFPLAGSHCPEMSLCQALRLSVTVLGPLWLKTSDVHCKFSPTFQCQ